LYTGHNLEALDIFRLAAARVVTAHRFGVACFLNADAVWKAAHVDEDWNVELWGEDEEAAERRVRRFAEMAAAARLLDLLR
jgi:chaperone required for assembly of F1-ATPase